MTDNKEPSYEALPDETKEFLAGLRKIDIQDLAQAAEFARTTRTVGRVVRWFFVAVFSTFVAAASLGSSFTQIIKWFHGSDK